MTAQDLIQLLKEYPPDTPVYTTSYELDGDYVQVVYIKLDNDGDLIIMGEIS